MTENDEKIMKLKERIEEKRRGLKTKSMVFRPATNCMLVLDKISYNLHVETSPLLLIKLNSLRMSAKDLGMDTAELSICGFSLDEWISDVESWLEVERNKNEKKKLDSLEKQLTALLSDDKQTELQIDSLAAELES